MTHKHIIIRKSFYLFFIASLLLTISRSDANTYASSTLTDFDKDFNQSDVEKRAKLKAEILKAKSLLEADNGKLWGEKIWSDDLLIIDYDNTIYSLTKLPESNSDDSILFYKKIPSNTLSFTNTTQKYEGKEYATVLVNYLNDESSTIIHELFHLLQLKTQKFTADPVDYLDDYEARKLLRLEFQALKNTLKAIDEKKSKKEITQYFKDAFIFRKIRQEKYREFLTNELKLETLEGTANYTGFALSTFENKYQKTIKEINQREAAPTYTRPFPYATGPAYGFIFDYLKIPWKKGLKEIYNFLDIYEKLYLKSKLKISNSIIEASQKRSNYDEINRLETAKVNKQKELIDYYSKMFTKSPTLKVKLAEMNKYSVSFNMNGTLVLKDSGTIYSKIEGVDKSGGKNFGNFSTIEGKDILGVAGILGYNKDGGFLFEFPLPKKIEGNKVIGDFYEITLNENWSVVKESDGNMLIVGKKDN